MKTSIERQNSEGISITESYGILLELPADYPDESELIRNRIQNIIVSWNISTEIRELGTDVLGKTNLGSETGAGLVDALHKIFQNKDDWDGYGTPRISEPLKQKCFEILEIIGRNQFSFPYVFPVCGGGIQFEWKTGSKELEIEFNENNISVLRTEQFEGDRCRYIEDENINLDQISEMYLWLENI